MNFTNVLLIADVVLTAVVALLMHFKGKDAAITKAAEAAEEVVKGLEGKQPDAK